MRKNRLSAREIAMMAMMVALALIFSYVETFIPVNFGIPGVKLGLANIVIVIALCLMGGREALVISVVRVILSGFLFGNLISVLYSLAGGLLSLGVMLPLKKTTKFSVVTVSVFGGICHNVGQLIIAMIVVENLKLVYYIPVLLIAGFATGLLIGIVSNLILPRLRRVFSQI